MPYKVLSLFAGAGGMDQGFKSAGYEIHAANELDSYACQTYKVNHPESILFEGDIQEHMPQIIELSDIDVVIGGPPCQGFSVAGKMSPNDPRSNLVFSFCEVIETLKPEAFVMENVKALASLSKFQLIRYQLQQRFEKAGYNVLVIVLNAKDFGVPQSRERVFFIGTKHKYSQIKTSHFDIFKKPAITLREAIIHLGRAGNPNNPKITKAKITFAAKPVLRKSPYAGMLFNGQGRPLNPDSWSSTLPASMGGNRTPIIDEDHLFDNAPSWVEKYHSQLINGEIEAKYGLAPERLRRLTIDEAVILQKFPTNYKFMGPQSKIFSQIGNAVPCDLAKVVSQVVLLGLNNELKNELQKVKIFDMKLSFGK